jgi:hypothetical protein
MTRSATIAISRAFQTARRKRRGAHRPTRPEVGEVDHHGKEETPVFPEPVETGDGRLAGRERVPLDLHVQKELRDDSDHRGPQEDEADLRSDERPENELAGREPDAGADDTQPTMRQRLAAAREIA